jgi:hypothetical protein
MTPEELCEIARALAYRQRYRIPHSGHTVRRLLLAVGALVGQPVTFADGSTPPEYSAA